MPAGDELWNYIHSPLRPQLVYVAAKLRLADILQNGRVCSSGELAAEIGADKQALSRVLRGLVMIGILSEEKGQFSLTPQGELLRSDHPNSMRDAAIVNGKLSAAWHGLLHTVETGETAFDHVFGSGLFEYLDKNPDLGQHFKNYISKMTSQIAYAVVSAYDFSSFRYVIDIGGGSGVLLAAVLARNPACRGVLFDSIKAFGNTQAGLAIASYMDRCELVTGNFFEAVPSGGDAYLLQLVLHDWDDERATLILRNCYQAMSDGGKLLIVERLMTEDSPRPAELIEADLDMLVLTGGKERSGSEMHQLCASAGFQEINVIPMNYPWAIVEAVK